MFMKCTTCRGEMQERTPEEYAEDEQVLGLPNVLLVGGGVTLSWCPTCGQRKDEPDVTYQHLGPMMDALAGVVVTKHARLTGQEIRFLRKHLGMTAEDLGKLLDVKVGSISRWETGALQMSPMAERLFRHTVLAKMENAPELTPEQITDATAMTAAPAPLTITLRWAGKAWRPVVGGVGARSRQRRVRAAAPARRGRG